MGSLVCAILLAAIANFAAIDARAAEDPSLANAIRGGLQRSPTAVQPTSAQVAEQQTLLAAYAHHEFRPFWSRDDKATQPALALLATLRAADSYGLRPSDYLNSGEHVLAEPLADPSLDHSHEVERWPQFDLDPSAAA